MWESRRDSWPSSRLIGIAALTLVYLLLGHFFRTSRLAPIAASLTWPPAAVALAALLLFGFKLWPGIVLGAILEPLASGLAPSHFLGSSQGIILEVVAPAYLLRRLGFRNEFDRVRDVLQYLLLAVLVFALLGSLVNALYQTLTGFRGWDDFPRFYLNCYRTDALAFLVLTPALITWGTDRRFQWLRERPIEGFLLLLSLFVVSYGVLGGPASIASYLPLRSVLFPFILWAALRFEPPMAAAANVIIMIAAGRAVIQAADPLRDRPDVQAVILWAFIPTISLIGFLLASGISERRRAEKAWLASQEKFGKAFHSNPQAMFISTLADGRWMEVNEALLRAYGATREEVIGTTAIERGIFTDPSGRDLLVAKLKKEGAIHDEEVWLRIRSGDSRLFRVSVEPIRLGGEDCVLGVASDVTESKQVEDRLRQSEEKFAKAFYSHPNPMVLSRLDGRLLDCNGSYLQFFGYSREEALRHQAWDYYVRPTDWDALAQQILQGNLIRGQEVQLRTKTGEARTALVSADVIDVGGERCVLGVIHDITAQRSAEEKAAKAFRASPDPISIATLAEGRLIEVNDAFLRAYGAPREEVVGRTEDELNVWVDIPHRQLLEEKLRKEGAIREEETRLRIRSGEVRLFRISAELIELDGEPCAIGVAHDITEQQKAEQEFRAAEERFRKAFRLSPVPMAVRTLDDGRYVEVNESFLRAGGFSREEVVGRTSRDVGLDPGGQKTEEFLAVLRRQKRVENFEYSARIKSGETREGLVFAEVIDVAGQPHVLMAILDVTEQRKLQEQFRKAFHSSPLAMSISTLDEGIYVEVNDSYLQLTGYSRNEVVGHSALQLDVWAKPEKRPELMALLRQQGRVRNFEFEVRPKTGPARSTLLHAETIDLGGKPHILAALLDMTDYRRLEEQLRLSQKMEAVGLLAGGIAHDFNNLLGVIIGYADLVNEQVHEEARLSREVQEIVTAATRAASLTRQLLAFSRRQVLQPRVIHLSAIVQDISKMLQRLIGERIVLLVSIQENLWRTRADPGQIEQVIMNLAVNARDAMPEGGTLTLEASNAVLDEGYALQHVAVRPGNYVMLAISDTGTGMDAATKARIFEPFFTTKEAGRGTGLGLATVYGIVKQSGGYIWVYSEPGRGSTFKIYLPQTEEPLDEFLPESGAPTAARGTETVLLVEDDEALQKLTRECLEEAGYQVLAARDGPQALRVSRDYAGEIHLLLTDVVLPGISGPELAQQLRASRAGIRFLFVSGYADASLLQQGLLNPSANLVQKPFRPLELAQKVREILNGSPQT